MNSYPYRRYFELARTRMRLDLRRALFPALFCAALLTVPPGTAAAADAEPKLGYTLDYTLTPVPDTHHVRVRLLLGQERALLREMRFDQSGISDLTGDGQVSKDGKQIVWNPPANGGELAWTIAVKNRRGDSKYDAWLGQDWGLFRAEDVVPRAATRSLKGAYGKTELEFKLPKGWSVVTEYRERDGRISVSGKNRRFIQPSGWIVMGELGVRREHIAGTRVAVAGPMGEDVRRMDMLALLNWTLPELARILPAPPERLTIVSAGKPMWRGGLSAPQSLYIHADRPLISENGTSTLLHEVMHVAMRTTAEPGYDWIVEGFAEYYSLVLLARGGSITMPRFHTAIQQQRDWSKSADELCADASTGPRTAKAVVVFYELDQEIARASRGKYSLDDVLGGVLESGKPLNLDLLSKLAGELIGGKPDALHSKELPGCAKLRASIGT
ncbi:MAG TPA: hypothetical protein PKK10_01325 [Woeseiaceae bacterium]|nr:hypothetical protein [Woeseiaceae bacterium]